MTRFLIADDHPLFRDALIGALTPYFSDAIFAQADDFGSTMRVLTLQHDFDAVLLDLNMPGVEYLFGLMEIKERYPNIPVIIVSASENAEVVAQAIALGASGYIPKSIPTAEFAKAIIDILHGNVWLPPELKDCIHEVNEDIQQMIGRFKTLTPKQMLVLSHLKSGLMNKQIAHKMDVSEATVKAHISAVLKKLDVKTRTQAILLLDKFQL